MGWQGTDPSTDFRYTILALVMQIFLYLVILLMFGFINWFL